MNLFGRKKKDKVYANYPCSVFLHNALGFIEKGKPELAYTEICHALIKAGDNLPDEEFNRFLHYSKED